MAISQDRIRVIADRTVGQNQNPLWHSYRKNRITASHFGEFTKAFDKYLNCTARYESGFNLVKYKIIRNEKPPPVPAIEWGIKHESDARHEYEKRTGQKVIETGIWLFQEGHLGASPDGLILDPSNPQNVLGIIEIKCPFRMIDIQIATGTEWKQHLEYLEDGNKLKHGHNYYDQVQGQMLATRAQWCDFVLWSPNNINIERIFPDKEWETRNLTKLEVIYLKYFLRGEDREFKGYERKLCSMEEINLDELLSETTPPKRKIYRLFVYTLAVHLSRIFMQLRHEMGGWVEWDEFRKENIEKMKSRVCGTCFLKLFLHLWRVQNLDEEIPHELLEIKKKKWSIPERIMQRALFREEKLRDKSSLYEAPCMCLLE